MPIHPKVAGATAAATVAGIIIAILNQSGVPVTADLASAIVALLTLVGGYLTPAQKTIAAELGSFIYGSAGNASSGTWGFTGVSGTASPNPAPSASSPPPTAEKAPTADIPVDPPEVQAADLAAQGAAAQASAPQAPSPPVV